MKRWTAVELAALRPGERLQRVTVDRGLQLRISPHGERRWVVRYTINGKVRDYTLPKSFAKLSDAAHLSLSDARSEAARIIALARTGIDVQVPQEDAKKADEQRREAERAADATVGELFESWINNGVNRKDGNVDLQRRFAADVLPSIGGIKVSGVNDQHIHALLRTVVQRDAPRAAVILRNDLAQMFSWAGKRQPWRRLLVEGNPMDLVEVERIVPPEYDMSNERERYLTEGEITELKRRLDAAREAYDTASNRRIAQQPLERTTELAIWIMLSTLCRVGELSLAKWEHIDFSKGEWRIPKQNIKRGRNDFLVFLSEFAQDRFTELHNLTGHTAWCFPSVDPDRSIGPKAITRQIGDRQCMFKRSRTGGPRQPMAKRSNNNSLVLANGRNGAWCSHDLRRTGATLMQALGINLDLIDRCQNHVVHTRKVRKHYLLYEYAAEKRHAWNLLSQRLQELTSWSKR